jgi:hypothetical protein
MGPPARRNWWTISSTDDSIDGAERAAVCGLPPAHLINGVERSMTHLEQQTRHHLAARAPAVRRGVQQTEHRMGAGTADSPIEQWVELKQDVDPQLCVLVLEGADAFALKLRGVNEFAHMHRDQRGAIQRELDMPPEQFVERRGRSCGRSYSAPSAIEQILTDTDEHLTEELLLAGEVVIERWTRHTYGGTEIVDGDAMEAALREQLGRHI